MLTTAVDAHLEKQTFVWSSPTSITLDVVDFANTAVTFCRSQSTSDGADRLVRLTYTIDGKHNSKAAGKESTIATVTERFHNHAVNFKLRTPSSYNVKLFKRSEVFDLGITVEIPDACQAGLDISVLGWQDACSISFADDFPAAFGDVDLNLGQAKTQVGFIIQIVNQAQVTAKSLSVRKLSIAARSHPVHMGELTASESVSIKVTSADVQLAAVNVHGRSGLTLTSSDESEIHVGKLSGTKATIRSAAGNVELGTVDLTDDLLLSTSSATTVVDDLVRVAYATIDSASGNTRVRASAGFNGTVRATSASGNVAITQAGVNVDSIASSSHHEAKATIGSAPGGSTLHVSSASGNIDIRTA
ncbi:hypothetical protein BC831DRAFT_511880 [Entophlyctis helioformis]|nr:hypothetical protein BC831DRAFT_511880 [Entophlyctis helioformis]